MCVCVCVCALLELLNFQTGVDRNEKYTELVHREEEPKDAGSNKLDRLDSKKRSRGGRCIDGRTK